MFEAQQPFRSNEICEQSKGRKQNKLLCQSRVKTKIIIDYSTDKLLSFDCRMLEEAAKIAYDAKDDYSLNYVLSKCGPTTRMVAEKISLMRSQLSKK